MHIYIINNDLFCKKHRIIFHFKEPRKLGVCFKPSVSLFFHFLNLRGLAYNRFYETQTDFYIQKYIHTYNASTQHVDDNFIFHYVFYTHSLSLGILFLLFNAHANKDFVVIFSIVVT